MEPLDDVRLHHIIVSDIKWSQQERIRRATRVRTCNYVKIKTGQNFPPVLKIVTHCAGCVNVNVAKRARDRYSTFSTVQ